jgi:large subunit ribosomal protein L22
MIKEQKAFLRYLSIAPRKVRLIANTLRKLSVSEAQAQLILRPHRTAEPLLKLLNSAISNAKNNGLDISKLVVAKIWVDPAPVLQRSLPRSQGRATPILKRMSHVTIVLAENEKTKPSRFIITAPEKKVKKEAAPKKGGKVTGNIAPKPAADHEDHKKADSKVDQKPQGGGAIKRLFNRKSV